MRKYLLFFVSLIVSLALLSGCATSGAPAQSPPAAQTSPAPVPSSFATIFVDIIDVAEHSVVAIDTASAAAQGAGSGWFIDQNGTIVTANHVVEGATTITATLLDGKTYPAQVINTDSAADIALLKINAGQLPALKVADASGLRVGDWVVAIGNPLGMGISANNGIVSRLGVDVQLSATQTYHDLIETNAAINPGNSGGALINLQGEVVGITTLKVSAAGVEGMGYAINMVDALPVIQKLSAGK